MAKIRVKNKGLQILISIDNSYVKYYDKDKSSWSARSGSIFFTYDGDDIFNEIPDNFEEPNLKSVLSLLDTLNNMIITTYSLGYNGLFDYNDNATTSSPIVVTGGAGYTQLTNDSLGTFTTREFAPIGVTDIWDTSTNSFDWSQLKLGDQIDIRLDINIIVATNNTEVDIIMTLGSGAAVYNVSFLNAKNYKSTGTYNITTYNSIYLGNEDTLNNGGVFKIESDTTCTVVVNGWYCRIIRR